MNNRKAALRRAARIELARRSLWYYCKAIAPDFYRDDRPHLRKICDTLQALYEGRIVRYGPGEDWQVVAALTGTETEICKKYMQNVPPQHGKTRTLVNFSSWVFGKNPKEKIITGSYNDSTASDFSRYTRDAITMSSVDEDAICYSDIFPDTKIKRGNAGFEKWALEGSHFSYLGVGVGGSVTSKGGTILIVDDPVKSADEALNENALDKIWMWYSSTFSSRVAAQDGEPIEILNMTRWSDQDPCGRILDSSAARDWCVLKFKAYDEATDTMLCPSLFSRKRFDSQRVLVFGPIFSANYQQETVQATGTLFPEHELNRFTMEDIRLSEAEAVAAYTDVADQGDDALCMPIGHLYPQKVFVTDVVFTTDGVELTIPLCAAKMDEHGVEYNRIESNNQGKLFRQMLGELVAMDRLLSATSHASKHTRIVMLSGFIKKYFYFLRKEEIVVGSQYYFFMKQLCAYMKDGSSKKDDAPDGLSGLAEFVRSWLKHLFSLLPLNTNS